MVGSLSLSPSLWSIDRTKRQVRRDGEIRARLPQARESAESGNGAGRRERWSGTAGPLSDTTRNRRCRCSAHRRSARTVSAFGFRVATQRWAYALTRGPSASALNGRAHRPWSPHWSLPPITALGRDPPSVPDRRTSLPLHAPHILQPASYRSASGPGTVRAPPCHSWADRSRSVLAAAGLLPAARSRSGTRPRRADPANQVFAV